MKRRKAGKPVHQGTNLAELSASYPSHPWRYATVECMPSQVQEPHRFKQGHMQVDEAGIVDFDFRRDDVHLVCNTGTNEGPNLM